MRLTIGRWRAGDTAATWDLDEHPHGIVTGQTGTGKYYLLRSIVDQATTAADVWLAMANRAVSSTT